MNSAFSTDLSLSRVPLPQSLKAGLQALPLCLSQHARLLSIETALGPDALIVESFSGHESMSGLFRFKVDCLATFAHCELSSIVGEEACLRMRLADGSTRPFHGIVTTASLLGGAGSTVRYGLTLEPWLHALTLRRDSYVFQDKSVLDIVAEIFRDYPHASYRFDVSAPPPKRAVTMQYRESDYQFITRLLADEGLNFYIRHDTQDGHSEREAKAVRAGHCFVVFDDNASLAPCAQRQVRFHRADATERSDTITLFAQRRRVQANSVTQSSWDYRELHTHAADDQAGIDARGLPPLEVFEGRGAHRYSSAAESARFARARAESLALQHQICHGESAVRAFSIGAWFELTGHAASGPAEYVVLSIEHRGANNLSAHDNGLSKQAAIEGGTYRNHFTCVYRTTPIRPAWTPPKPTAGGAQVALVVGVASEEITTERDHRIKVRFPWQRGERMANGQFGHPAAPNGPGNETTGNWVRLAEPAAGANWGSNFIARIGQEVLVDFIDGDIDRPVVIGQLYNGSDIPPYHGAGNHPGALAGIRTKEYGAGGFNQWSIDDTPQQLRQSLVSSYSASQLNVGYLIRRIGNVRGAFRGTGFELITDVWSTIRAKRGIFISTAQRTGAASTQLDAQEAQGKLSSASDLAHALSDASAQHQALPLSTSAGVRGLVKTITAINPADGRQAPAFEQPVALLDSRAGISVASPASSVLLAGQDLTLSATSALRMSAGQAASLAAAKTLSLFTHAGGAKVIAAKEPVSVRAHAGPMDALAERTLAVTSSGGRIKIQAKQEILLASGGGYIKLAGSNIDIHCPSSLSVKGSTHEFLGPGNLSAGSPDLPEGRAPGFPYPANSPISPKPERYSGRLLACNPITGESLSAGYALIHDGTVIEKGRTTGDGFSIRHIQDRDACLAAFVGPSSPWTVEYHSGAETPSPINDEGQDISSPEADAQ
ncbi:type VI secretion system Vgr family protein [Noviherbaspirillum sp. UKPF54]|uniref:type VI secretion system Vgr family protein n=1 Tax=Noviherbaspirillum sp. UKPF54 TaxID=2601898 RepID=UPI0011B10389|nr:type VI secretion system Vgr family protein [Noviherbaspirillum sp. UKPF54]QDZ27658.1 type VI secretion system tip protein VgrG [Noviherbaspirillum sp. UKPF54]